MNAVVDELNKLKDRMTRLEDLYVANRVDIKSRDGAINSLVNTDRGLEADIRKLNMAKNAILKRIRSLEKK